MPTVVSLQSIIGWIGLMCDPRFDFSTGCCTLEGILEWKEDYVKYC